MASANLEHRNQDATCYCGNLDDRVTEEILWELMLQAGPIVSVYLPKDKVSGSHQGYGFVEFRGPDDADYAYKIMNMVKLFGKPLRVKKANQDTKALEVGANLFIGGLDPDVDEKLLYDTFGAFGTVVNTPKVARDPDTGLSKGYGFVQYDSFEASDMAIECMNGQFLCNQQISVQYAYKKDGAPGERHGSQAERILAANRSAVRPNQNFGVGPGAGASAGVATPVAGTPQPQPTMMMGMQNQPAVGIPPPMPPATAVQTMQHMPMGMLPHMMMGMGQIGQMGQMGPPPLPTRAPPPLPARAPPPLPNQAPPPHLMDQPPLPPPLPTQ